VSSACDRIVCGIDGSEEAFEAARQASRLARQTLVLLAAVDPWDLVLAGPASDDDATEAGHGPAADRLRAEAAATLENARREIELQPGCALDSKLVERRPADALLSEATRSAATLIVVGPSGRGRLAGIALGSVATALVHRAPCAVLVARRTPASRPFPSRIVVGVDGSYESALACSIARELRERFGASTQFIVGTVRADVDAARSAAVPDYVATVTAGAVGALIETATDTDLIVVGSRGLHGLRALGSVSERAVHAAKCSVLVAREPATPGADTVPNPTLVGELMTTPAVVAPEEAGIDEIARRMLEHEIGAVPIVSQDGKLVGIVSESDFSGREVVFATSRHGHEIRLPKVLGELLTRADALEGLYERAQRLPARTVMSRPVHVATEDEPVQQALTRMLHHQIDHMPVVRAGVPVGMLARFDLIRLASQTWDERRAGQEASDLPRGNSRVERSRKTPSLRRT
jgi:nucleotide-binding universal stress UspA family protein/predicted transcriptional regulator